MGFIFNTARLLHLYLHEYVSEHLNLEDGQKYIALVHTVNIGSGQPGYGFSRFY